MEEYEEIYHAIRDNSLNTRIVNAGGSEFVFPNLEKWREDKTTGNAYWTSREAPNSANTAMVMVGFFSENVSYNGANQTNTYKTDEYRVRFVLDF